MTRWVVGGCLLVAAAACSPTANEDLTVDVQMRYSRFIPDDFEVAAGTTVTFVVTNDDPIDHEFLIGDERVQQAHEEGTEAHHGAKPGEISVPAGETRSTAYTFTDPGRLLIGCHLPTHYDYGMRGTIDVSASSL